MDPYNNNKKKHMFEGSIALSSTALILEALRAVPPTAISQTNRWVEPAGLNEKEVNSLKKKITIYQFPYHRKQLCNR